jgi:hypothetical protein
MRRPGWILLTVLLITFVPSPASSYSVLTHEATIDAAWDASIKPLLRAKFPGATDADLDEARAYAYGGCVIHDLGYYPFGSKFFSNLLHYVRSGDFVQAMIANARDLNEYAFALGAVAHYASDNTGHPIATNRAVPMMYPKLRAQFGDSVPYDLAPKQHILVEFSFDVLHVAAGAYAPEAFHRFIGFKVAEDLVDRTFKQIYALDMGDQFMDRSLAIGTYRYAVSKAIPEMTKVAWKKKRDDIERATPGMTQANFIFNLSRRDYEKEFGSDYAKPKGWARIIAFLYHLVPKIGPFRALAFKVPSPDAEKLFLESFERTKERYAQALRTVAAGQPALANINCDVGRETPRGAYALADQTYDTLLEKLAKEKFAGVSTALRADLARHFGNDPRLNAARP